jgi:ribosome biogenesis GTPase A
MAEIQNIQWFPGHMTKTRRKIESSLKLVDAVCEIIDARIPISSRNPDLSSIIERKPRIVLLNKSDIADEFETKKWKEKIESEGAKVLLVDCKSGKGLNKFDTAVKELLAEKLEKNKEKGMAGKTLRIMVVGIPNVGKSSFINRMAKEKKAKVEDRPGVTRGNQWFSIGNGLELLDTPGVLWPKFEDKEVGQNLAFTGAIKDVIMDIEELAYNLFCYLCDNYPDMVKDRYKIDFDDYTDRYDLFNEVGKKRGMIMSGGHINTDRLSTMILDEFRSGKIGRITLEKVK